MSINEIYFQFLLYYNKHGFSELFGKKVAMFLFNSVNWEHSGARQKIKYGFTKKIKDENILFHDNWKRAYEVYLKLLEE